MEHPSESFWPQAWGPVIAALSRQLRRRSAGLSLLGLAILLCTSALLFIGTGPVHVSPAQTCAILLSRIGLNLDVPYTAQQATLIVAMRLPRAVLAAVVGGGLALAGATLQGLFRSPLADPGLMGMSGGAALATAGMVALAHRLAQPLDHLPGALALPLAGCAGAAAALWLGYKLSELRGRAMVTTMVLIGVMLNTMAGGTMGLLTYLTTHAQIRDMTFWSLGSLGHSSWLSLLGALPEVLVACVLVVRLPRALNAILLGEADAKHLGFDPARLRLFAMAFAALAVGTSVTLAGTIGFVGLVAPQLARLILGGDHKLVLPGSALLGAAFVLWADVLSRTLAVPAEIPIGLLTGLIGAPAMLWLVLNERSRLGV